MQRRKPNAGPVRCASCPSLTSNPRDGQCDRCYQRSYHGRELGTACACCTYGVDPRALVRKTLADGTRTLCGNCAAIAGRRPLTLAELRAEVRPASDRRQGGRRRLERRSFRDRRDPVDLGRDDERRRLERRAG